MPKPSDLRLEPSDRGPLFIWEMPREGAKYAIGIDTAYGLSRGDYAVAQVIEAESCSQVALWREKADPHIFGVKCAWLGWFYNEAILGFETGSAASGVTACQEAIRQGYRNVYRKMSHNTFTKKVTETLGFPTNVQTKMMVIDRIKVAIEDPHCYIHDQTTLQQLRTRVWDAKGYMDGPGHDDDVMALGIAYMVRDDSWKAGKLRSEVREPQDPLSRYWRNWQKQVELAERRRARPVRRNPTPPWRLP